ncbi:SpoIIE family protein phosphatase [Streptomyces sp. NPDC058045]|uniref:SpoIIE family protein phosphatase n=1 Tax=Streptomyces sp. NPDC058045 TaxID=3346311 RepID=UPI0036EFD796
MEGSARRSGGLRSWLSTSSVAGQVLLVQIVVAVLLVAAGVIALQLQVQGGEQSSARSRSLAAAAAFATAPSTAQALTSAHPGARLQPQTGPATRRAHVDFIAVAAPNGIRLADTDPTLIGDYMPGTERAVAHGDYTDTFRGPPSTAARAVVPVTDGHGKVVGVVAAGVRIEHVSAWSQRRLPVVLGAGGIALLLAGTSAVLVSRRLRRQTHGIGPAEMTRMYEHHDAVLHSVREGVLIIAGDGRLQLANDEARRLLALPADAEGRHLGELGLDTGIADLLTSDRTVTDEVHPAGDRLLAVSTRRTPPGRGAAPGTAATLRDTTELRKLSGIAELARDRLAVLYDAGVRLGSTLDVVQAAEELAEATAGRFADVTTVELLEPVLEGEEPGGTPAVMRRVALAAAGDGGAGAREAAARPVGTPVALAEAGDPAAAALHSGHAVLVTAGPGPAGAGSMIAVPLQARGAVLGLVTFRRGPGSTPYEEDDRSFADELAARAAVAVDNARRYTREHNLSETLQRSLLPHGFPELDAVKAAYRYLPAQAGVGGDWFDLIPLPGARVALVIGDVVGHGLHAAATMGRLRTAVHNFARLDIPPDEVLWHLDELVKALDEQDAVRREPGAEGADGVPAEGGITGATCLYAIYDPANGQCTMARAGHFAPALLSPDGTVHFPEVPTSPPLGLATLPCETATVTVPEGSRLVLFTDGLVERRDRDIDTGLDLLAEVLAAHTDRTPDGLCRAVVERLLPEHRHDDIALLIARTRLLPPSRVAEWDVPSEPAAVAPVRAACVRQVTAWGLDEAAFTTELMLSELITNAIRYGTQPVHVRLLLGRTTLTCEVSDGSNTSPHLRRAALGDEGGRGLFLVAQLAERWGTRYTTHGKVIWTEQPRTGPPGTTWPGFDLSDLPEV